MNLKGRLIAAGVLAAAAVITFGIAKSGRLISDKQEDTVFSGRKETLYLWYADEGLDRKSVV